VTRAVPAAVRFARHVDTSGGPDACHPWTGTKIKSGYGHFREGDRVVRAHRFAWELANGPVPEGAKVDHVCHNGTDCPGGPTCPHRRCCNVRHLEPTTDADNTDRSHLANAHKTRCPRDHEYTPENTWWRPPERPGRRPRRRCRACDAEGRRARREVSS
jgi:hypothetical protein